MQIHQLKRETKQKAKRQIGRGGKRGTTAGRGTKGQKARAGHKIRPEIRDQIKKLPKRRGYHFQSFQVKPRPVNLDAISRQFENGDIVSPETLVIKGIERRRSGKLPAVKILASGELTKKVKFVNCAVSAAAKEKIEKAGSELTADN